MPQANQQEEDRSQEPLFGQKVRDRSWRIGGILTGLFTVFVALCMMAILPFLAMSFDVCAADLVRSCGSGNEQALAVAGIMGAILIAVGGFTAIVLGVSKPRKWPMPWGFLTGCGLLIFLLGVAIMP